MELVKMEIMKDLEIERVLMFTIDELMTIQEYKRVYESKGYTIKVWQELEISLY